MVTKMDIINVLDDATINKIAAGEVVERPVSVVKELVENSIDAGATNISVEIKDGGIEYIRVSDNGRGIEKNNIPKVFLRHATSKIRSIEDLAVTTTLGFRGEALSSIASVSRVELLTKSERDILGYSYRINGGRCDSFDEAGVPDGTTVIVRNLFYNTPARRKFLKSAVTEAGHITELMEKLILSHPSISFKYTVNGIVKLSSDGLGDVSACIYSLFGRETAASSNSIDHSTEACSINGFAGKPEIARGNRNFELFFVNGRFIKSKILSSAVEEAYKPYLMLHKFPFVLLYINIPSDRLDVNVHPAKTEIRFLDEREVFSTVFDAVTDAVTRKELIPDISLEETSEKKEKRESTPPAQMIPEPFETKALESYRINTIKEQINKDHAETKIPVQENLFKDGFLSEEARSRHRVIGQIFDTYWIIEYENKLYIIDQHAAHEKVLYERLVKQINANSVISQAISPPYIVSLTAAEEETVKKHVEIFRETGFEIEHFGQREYALSSVPSELFGMSEQDYFLSVVDDLTDTGNMKEPDQIKDRIATMACKAAVKGNMRMSFAEADALINELLQLDNPYNCPHGRPTIISFSKQELEKMFKRIV